MSRLLQMESTGTIVDLLSTAALQGLGKNQRMNGSIFLPKGNKAPQDQRSLARKYNKIGDEIEHDGHTNMFTKYSYSFRVLTSKTHQSADILSYLNCTNFRVYFLENVHLNVCKVSNYGGQTRCNFFLRLSELFVWFRRMDFANWLTSLNLCSLNFLVFSVVFVSN